MIVYLSGPISNRPNQNREAFAAAAEQLRSLGLTVVNPHELFDWAAEPLPWAAYMREDLKALLLCDRILMLRGWKQSRGARLERIVAEAVGIKEYHLP